MRGVGDQLDDDLMADQRLAAPVLGDEGEQAVLDAVPFAGAGRQMADGDRHPEFVGQHLQFALPQPHARAVAAAAIGGDQQPRGGGIADACRSSCHQRRMLSTAKAAVSWVMPRLTQPALAAMS